MASHFSSIGIPLANEEEFLALANRVAGDAEPVEVSQGRYLRWSSSSGAEVWLQVDRGNDLVGMTPHFAGESRIRVGITARVKRPNDSLLDGAFHGWASPDDKNPESGCYPFVFDSPDYWRYERLPVPSLVEAQIAAFAHEVSVFESVEAYDASQADEPKFASQSFIPSGLFTPQGESTEPPQAYAIISGHVARAETRRNDLTGRKFYWALVEAFGGAYDVVIDPDLAPSPPRVGGVVTGSFWLSGRLTNFPQEQRGFFRKVFGR